MHVPSVCVVRQASEKDVEQGKEIFMDLENDN